MRERSSPTTCHTSRVTYHVSCVTCPMSCKTFPLYFYFLWTKWFSLLVDGLLSTGPTLSSFITSSSSPPPPTPSTILLILLFLLIFFLFLLQTSGIEYFPLNFTNWGIYVLFKNVYTFDDYVIWLIKESFVSNV